MSAWSDRNNATLGEIIAHLKALPPSQVVTDGFGRPHSYRGYYEDLAFEPIQNTTVGAMLAAAESALGKTYHGWKGGEYAMDERTDCWLAECGDTGMPIVLPGERRREYTLPIAPGGDDDE